MYKGEIEIYDALKTHKKSLTLDDLSKLTNFNPDSIRRALESLREKGAVETSTKEMTIYEKTPELESYLQTEFPEYSVYKKSLSSVSINELSPIEKSIGIKWAKQKGLVSIEEGKLKPSISESLASKQAEHFVSLVSSLLNSNQGDKFTIEELLQRKLVSKRTTSIISVSLANDSLDLSKESTFDFSTPSVDAPMGKAHIVSALSDKIKQIMVEMGFCEMEGDIVESSFWNFDSLFQPQDHPARELADTFYLKGESSLPSDKNLVNKIKTEHEKGWRYSWSEKEASKKVLRTHTTALSARYLSKLTDKSPKKYFAVGKVFRNEATDYKHLAEFHQVEGIIAYEGATFTDLLGTLKEFYKKLGFEKIRFRPSFFPYTEPSLEIEVYFEPRKQWMELGGAGIFRPEVSIPLCGVYPVLAWGLSLERPLMLSLNLDDIRTLYKNDVEFLRKARLDL